VAAFLEALAAGMRGLGEGAALAGIMEQCAYCGASLGRVGLDFRPLLAPLFCGPVEGVVRKALAAGVDGFERSLAQHRWTTAPAPVSAAQAPGAGGGEDSQTLAGPPAVLMDHPPVAVLLNGLLAALNELRHVPLPALREPLARALHDALAAASGVLVRAHSTMAPGDTASTAACRSMAAAMVDVAAPYAATCYGRIYPGAASLVDVADAVDGAAALAHGQ
jgi:hypothetical protein